MNMTMILSIVAGLALGLAVAYINTRITRKNLKASDVGRLMGTNALRMLLDIAALALGYFGSAGVGLMLFPVLIATAAGLSIGGLIFLKIMLNFNADNDKTNDRPDTEETVDNMDNKERGE